ncbi:MAG TPA: LuxR C-terminal-related transcriptional regulator [Baekduia sp.]|nr:LuxR C-terminal-related transcriptional regulator [Baekduia sp.]
MDVAIPTRGAVAPAKHHVPARRDGLVACDALVDQLVASRDAPLVVATGAGASALLAQWAHAPGQSRPFAWLALDPEDADPVRFWRGVIGALRAAHPGFGAEAERLLRIGAPALRPAIVPLIAAEAAVPGHGTVLVLDGLDRLGTAAEVHATLELLLDARAAELTVAIAARTPTAASTELSHHATHAMTIDAPADPPRLSAATAIDHPQSPPGPARAAALVADRWEAALARGEAPTVLAWLDALSPDAADAEPRLWPVRLWAALEAGRAEEVARLIASGPAPSPGPLRTRGLLLHAHDALRRGDLAATARRLDRVTGLDAQSGFWHTTEALLRALESFWRGRPRVAYRHFLRAAGLAEIHGDRLALAYATGYLALIAAEGADRDGARRRLDRLEDLRDEDPATGEHAVACAGALAEGRLLELAGACESAVAPLERAAALAGRGGSLHERAEPLLRLAAVHRACQRPGEAAACDARAAALLAGCPDLGRLAGPAAAVAPPGSPRDVLSPSELAVLRLLPTGLSQREIGAELYLSVNTVKTHCRNIYTKIHAGSREQAVARARRNGLL